MKIRQVVGTLACGIGACVSNAGEKAISVSQYGITWRFDAPVEAGRFVNGDWWVVGPVTVVSVTPAPGPAPAGEKFDAVKGVWGDTSQRDDKRMRNGSMVVAAAGGRHGYDSRSQSFDPKLSAVFPLRLEPHQSLISTISHPALPVDNFAAAIMWRSEKKVSALLKAAAILTVLPEPPPADAFRPAYVGGAPRKLYRAASLRRERLLRLPAPAVEARAYAPDYTLRIPEQWEQMERYFERPWLEHLTSWHQQQLNPTENQPCYGREHGRLVSMASLLLLLDVPPERKERLLIGLVQYGLDISALAQQGVSWNWGGGHTSGRKWPMVFASLMLDDPDIRAAPETVAFHEDAQTYYGAGWFGQTALYWMVQHHGQRDRYEERPPETWQKWDKSSEAYRVCCNAVAWVGTALAARLMGAVPAWGHDAFFDYCDRWMRLDDPYAADRAPHKRPAQETKTFDPFVDAMWRTYRERSPDQPRAGNPRQFVWQGRNGVWIANPPPTEDEVRRHVETLKTKRP